MSRLQTLLTFLPIALSCVGAEPVPSRWAFQSPSRPPIPTIAQVSVGLNPIDRFVIASLEAQGLSLSPQADRRTLIRRLYLNVLGLPPGPEEIAEFLNDPRPDAYERLVDRLLASPHYGENLGRLWLDVARFTESQGFERDKPREYAWPYRDYVIRSFNHDKPYDRFVLEQLAGDLLPDAGSEGVIATGFLTCGPYDEVGHSSASPSVRARAREDELEDIVSTVAQTFLGLTVNCARCHDHKFDPIPQADYYRIRSVFDAVRPGDRLTSTEAERKAAQQRLAQIDVEMEKIHRSRSELEMEWRRRLEARKGSAAFKVEPRPIARWSFDDDARDQIGTLHGTLKGQARVERGRLVLDGAQSFVETRPLEIELREKTLEAWVVLPTRSQRGGAVLSVVSQDGQVFDAIVYGEMQPGRWMAGSDFFRRSREHEGEVENSAASDLIHIVLTYASDGQIAMYRNGRRYFDPYVPANPAFRRVTFPAGQARVLLGLRHPGAANGFLQGEIEEARLYDRALTPAEVEASFQRGPSGWSEKQWSEVASPLELQKWNADQVALVKLRQEQEELRREPRVYAAVIQPAKPARILHRGEYDKEGEIVAPGGLSAIRSVPSEFGLPPDAPENERRLAFARWVVHPNNPLTGRVIVNRLWRWSFGTGLVDTPSDFGVLGERPTNRPLLDWLATEFQQSGWSIKRLHRLILTSATYRQSFLWQDRAARIDPENRFLWRYPVRRLDAEVIRDSMLAVSGRLHRQVGGPSFRPFRIRIFNSTFYDLLDVDREEWNRRSIYRMHIQSAKDPLLECFDIPEPSVRTPKRVMTTTPLQALALMNSRFVNVQSQWLARRIEGQPDPVASAYELAYGRLPNAAERQRAESLRRDAGLAHFCWVVLNSSEFLYLK